MNPGRAPARRRWLGGGALAVMLAAAGPGRSAAPTPDPRVSPPGFAPLRERGAFELALADCEAALDQLLRAPYGPLAYARHAGSGAASDWAQLQTHYDRTLGSEWQAQPARLHRGFKLKLWQRTGWLPHQPVFGAAWLEEPVQAAGRELRLLVLVASRDGG